MKSKGTRLIGILTLLLATFSLAAWAFVSAHPVSIFQKPETDDPKRSLRELVQEQDVEVVIANLHMETESTDLRELAQSARAIILGQISKAQSSFTDDGQFTKTTYSIDVQRVLKNTTLEGLGPL